MLSYQNVKRGSIDICNICSERKKLSRDHVPPKTCYNSGKFEYTSIFPEIEKNKENVQKVQNGIKFRTICEQCNNERLGLFDKSLKDFYDYIFSIVISDIVVPEKVYYTGDINKICRSIFGHVLSMRKDYIKNNFEDVIRDYFLDLNCTRPEGIHLHFGIYPYQSIQIVRDVYCAEVLGTPTYPAGIISILKFFPLAFIVSEHPKFGNYQNFTDFCTSDINEKRKICIDLKSCFDSDGKLYAEDWPLRSSNGLVLLHDGVVQSSCRTKTR